MPTVQDIIFRCDSEQIHYYCTAMQTLDPEPLKASLANNPSASLVL
jgi:hypothetical protein